MQTLDRTATYNRLRQFATLGAIVATIAVNTFYNVFPVAGLNVGQISNQILSGVLITPANYAFAIWGLIYVGIVAFGIYQVLPAQRDNPRLGYARTGIFWASFFQILWIFAFQYQQFWLSVAYIFAILIFLITAYLGIRHGQTRCSRKEKWLVRIPISVYFGWITVATIVNVASALFASGWDGFGISPTVWTIVLLGIATAITGVIVLQFRDVGYSLVIVWAIVAVAIRNSGQSAIVLAGMVLASGILLLLLGRNMRPRKSAL